MKGTLQKAAYAVVATAGLLTVSACSSSDSAAEKALGEANDACERMQQTDQRQACFDAAMRKYQSPR